MAAISLGDVILIACGVEARPYADQVKAAGLVVDFCRARGMTYNDVFALVQRIVPSMTLPTWESLLYEADTEESYG
jgi:hypothetical protein